MDRREQSSIFVPPYPQFQLREPFTVLPPFAPSKRARRDTDEDEDEDDDSSGSERDGGGSGSVAAATTTTTTTTQTQPARYLGRTALDPREVRAELAMLKPPLHLPKMKGEVGQRRPTTLANHLKVLMAILHRCLRARDFVRAGRAWGMLLRTPLASALDLRHRGLYGMGAEILLHRGSEQTLEASNEALDSGTIRQQAPMEGLTLNVTREGFEAAKAYYQRLAVEYRYLHWFPNLLSGLDFYPAMYGLWIAFAQDSYIKARHAATHARPQSVDANNEDESTRGASANIEAEAGMMEEHTMLVQEAEKIEESMAELMIAPPYSDSVDLKELRRHMEQWLRQLRGPASTDHPSSPTSTGSQD